MLWFVAWFEIAIGVMIGVVWIALLVTRQVPELAEGRTDIWFHLAAELLTAALLVAGGIAARCPATTRRSEPSRSVRCCTPSQQSRLLRRPRPVADRGAVRGARGRLGRRRGRPRGGH